MEWAAAATPEQLAVVRADAARLVRYSDEEVANRDVRVWHGATENGP